uniref:V-type proton ATPase subunit S1-like n=1 Tax=Salmo trutta TaxID=8032 RepID=A0A673Y8J6_SALTR
MAAGRRMRMISARGCVFLAVLCTFSAGTCDEQVPLMLWTSEGSGLPSQAVPAAGHIVGISQLSSYLETALGSAPPNVLLFLQDKMSIEDFTMYGGAFGNKQDSAFPNLEDALLSSPSPLVLPAVAWPASSAVIGQLQDQLDTSPLYMEPETLSQLRLNASTPALLVFRLPYSTGYTHTHTHTHDSAYLTGLLFMGVLYTDMGVVYTHMGVVYTHMGVVYTHMGVVYLILVCNRSDLMSAKEVLNENDEVIGQVMSIMKSQSVPYTAVYTAMRPSREVSSSLSMDMEAGVGGGRSLLQYGDRKRERDRQRERERGENQVKEKTGVYPPVEFKVRSFFLTCSNVFKGPMRPFYLNIKSFLGNN